jgi:peptidyl-prolyl cis-trans isomerase B (cyclophilin B)
LNYNAVITTDAGDIELELYDDITPMTVENFVNLSRLGFYDGLEFHRVLADFVSQAGDPVGDGDDGPSYTFNDEFTRALSHDSAGVLSMANAGSNTNGSQFFITHDAFSWLDAYEDGVAKNCSDDSVSCHTVFGRVTAGLEIVNSMVERDPDTATTPGVKILSILIIES